METELFNRQYIISKKELALDGWKQFLFDNYHVYVHPNLDLSLIHILNGSRS